MVGAHRRVVFVSLDQADGSNGLHHPTLGRILAGELRDPGAPHDELRRHDFERLLPVEADHFPLAVRRAVFEISRHRQLHFSAGKMGRKRFRVGLVRARLATLVAPHHFKSGIGDPCDRVDHLGRIAEIDHELLRIGDYRAFLGKHDDYVGHLKEKITSVSGHNISMQE